MKPLYSLIYPATLQCFHVGVHLRQIPFVFGYGGISVKLNVKTIQRRRTSQGYPPPFSRAESTEAERESNSAKADNLAYVLWQFLTIFTKDSA